MYADPTALFRVLEQAKKRVEQFGKNMGKIGLGGAAAGGAVFAPLAKLFSEAVTEGADVAQLAKRYQMPVAALSELKNAFAEAGIQGEDFGATLDGLAGRIAAAATANEELIPGLQGLRGNMLIGKDPAQQLDAVFEAFQRIQSVSDQIDVSKQLGMEKLLPWLKKGKAGLEELRAQGKKNNDGWGAEDAAAAEVVFKEYNQTVRAVKSTLLEVGKALLPAGQDFATVGAQVRENLAAAREWIRDHRQLILIVAAVAGSLLTGGLAVAGFGAAVAVVAPIIGGLITAAVTLKAVVLAVLSPFGLAVAAMVALGAAAFITGAQIATNGEALKVTKEAFAGFASFVGSSWKGITDALSANDWSLAFEIGVATADVAWKAFVAGMDAIWVGFKEDFVDTWNEAIADIQVAMLDFSAWLLRNTVGNVRDMVDQLNRLLPRQLKLDVGPMPSDAEINAGRDEEKQKVTQAEWDDALFRAVSRGATKKESWDAMVIAMTELKRLKDQAAEEAKNKGAWGGGGDWGPDFAPQTAPPSFAALSQFAKGTFGSSAIQQSLGYGDNVGQRQLDAQIGIETNTAQAVKILGDIANKPGAVFKAG